MTNRQIWHVLACMFLIAATLPGQAQNPAGEPIALNATLAADGRSVELVWHDAIPTRARDLQISRRVMGISGANSWRELTVMPGRFLKYRDDTITPGTPYEYRLLRNHGDFFSAGYWVTGTDIPIQQDHGTVFIALDETLSAPLKPRLARLEDDLVGAGWQVRWLPTPRHKDDDPLHNLSQARTLKEQLRDALRTQPGGLRHMVLLLGHVPMVASGSVGPDGHGKFPHVSDLFYGDLTGRWLDNGAGVLAHSKLPNGTIEMPVGRVDFAVAAPRDSDLEHAYLRAYLDKTHHWRHGLLGDLRAAYAQSRNLKVEQFDLRNIVGPDAITAGGHVDAGPTQPWLWGVDFGPPDGRTYRDYGMKPVFAINFGSAKQKIDMYQNAMVNTLAQPFYTVAVTWGGRPSWRLHQMALGQSIGQMQLITSNNGAGGIGYPAGMDYVPTGGYPWRAPIWTNLLGDPTLHAFPLAPPRDLTAVAKEGHVELNWQGDAERYLLLRSSPEGAFAPLSTITGATRFVDETPMPGARYQLRALGKQEVYAGSFFTASQGIFTHVDAASAVPPDLRQSVSGPGPHKLMLEDPSALLAPLHPPQTGHVKLLAQGWHYFPEDGFEGQVDITLSASGSGQTVMGRLRLDVRP